MSVAFICGREYALPFTTFTVHTFEKDHVHMDSRGPMWNWTESMVLDVMVPAMPVTMLRVANDNDRKIAS